MDRFIKLIRFEDNPDIITLVEKHHNEFILLTVIAMRARRSSEKCKFNGLKQNEAMIGDYRKYGMTEAVYRSSKTNVQKWGYATFKGTSKGTIATLSDSRVYDINSEPANVRDDTPATGEPTHQQRTDNVRVTTKKNVKDEKDAKNEESSPSPSSDREVPEPQIKSRKNSPAKKRKSVPPTLDEVMAFADKCAEGKNPVLYREKASQAFAFYEGNMRTLNASTWKNGRGDTVKNWKLTIRNNWLDKVEDKPQTKVTFL